MNKYTAFYIILLFFIVGFAPANHSVDQKSTNLELRAGTSISRVNFHVPSEICRPAQLQLSKLQKRSVNTSSGGESHLAVLSRIAHLHFVSDQDYALEYSPIQKHLLHNFPSHHFW